MAALHVQCWRESLGDILPPDVIAGFDVTKMTAAWEKRLADPTRIIHAAYAGDNPVGFVIGGAAEPPGYGMDGNVAAIYVAARWHRKGLGKALMGLMARDWQAHGGRGLALEVIAANARARSFYDALGGQAVSTGTYVWDGHPLPVVVYHFGNLPALAALAPA